MGSVNQFECLEYKDLEVVDLIVMDSGEKDVNDYFKKNENPCTCPPSFPVCVCGNKSKGTVITRKPILPSEKELEENSRSKSAKLRVFEKNEL